jgi:hypothetical protein
MALLAVLLVPAMRALQTGIIGADVHSDIAANHFRLTSRLEELLAEPFVELSDAAIAAGAPTTATSFSDAVGPPGRLLVYLSLYDGDNADADSDPFTGTDADLLWIRVDIEDSVHTLQTIRASGH